MTGSHVARIYKDTAEQKKLHKYDGAFYSRMSMEIDGETKGNGVLNITAGNEGLDTELHLTINGGTINIQSCDDGINVNEDGISVFTMNDGYLTIYAGNGAEGDGIDSNGWNVINGGTVISLANPKSMDGGIDSDMGSTINGGTVIGAGNMYDPLDDDSQQLFMFLQLAEKTDQLLVVTDENNNPVFAYDFPNNYTYISFSTPELTEGTYHVYEGGTITGSETDGFYSTITSYQEGTKLHHGGTSTNQNMEMMAPPQGGNGPSFQEDGTLPEMPNNGQTPPKCMTNGGGFGGPQGMQSPGETESYDFVLTASNKGFTNVSSTSISASTSGTTTGGTSTSTSSTTSNSFTDVKNDSACYYKAVSWASQLSITKGIGSNTFAVGQSITIQDAITMLERYGKGSSLGQIQNISSTSTSPATRAQIAVLLMQYCSN